MTVLAKDLETVATAHGFTRVADRRDWWDNPIHQRWRSNADGTEVDVEYGAAPRHHNGTVLGIVASNSYLGKEQITFERCDDREVLESVFESALLTSRS